MRIVATLALLAAIVGGVAFEAHAYQNCTTNCQSYGNQTSCTRSCF
jgi:predicted metal-binding protein